MAAGCASAAVQPVRCQTPVYLAAAIVHALAAAVSELQSLSRCAASAEVCCLCCCINWLLLPQDIAIVPFLVLLPLIESNGGMEGASADTLLQVWTADCCSCATCECPLSPSTCSGSWLMVPKQGMPDACGVLQSGTTLQLTSHCNITCYIFKTRPLCCAVLCRCWVPPSSLPWLAWVHCLLAGVWCSGVCSR